MGRAARLRGSEGPLEKGKHESHASEDMPPPEHNIILALSLPF